MMKQTYAAGGHGPMTWTLDPGGQRFHLGLYPVPTRAECKRKGNNCQVTVELTDVLYFAAAQLGLDGIPVEMSPSEYAVLPTPTPEAPTNSVAVSLSPPRRRLGDAWLAPRVGPIIAVQDPPWTSSDPAGFETNRAASSAAAAAGFRAVKIWPRTGVLSEDFAAVMEDSRIDTVVIRPLHGARWDSQHTYHYTHELQDFGVVAAQLYARYRDTPKVVLISNCELDYQMGGWEGLGGDRIPTDDECAAMVALLDERQRTISQLRTAYATAPLAVYHVVEVARAGTRFAFDATRDLLPRLVASPDVVSYSWWASIHEDPPIEQALVAIERTTGLPRSRIILGEVGWYAAWSGSQYDHVSDVIGRAMQWGVGAAYVWSWQQRWEAPGAGSALIHPVTGAPTEAFRAAIDMARRWG